MLIGVYERGRGEVKIEGGEEVCGERNERGKGM
jgi:hypothetical protein